MTLGEGCVQLLCSAVHEHGQVSSDPDHFQLICPTSPPTDLCLGTLPLALRMLSRVGCKNFRTGVGVIDFNTRNKHNSCHNAIVWRSWVCGSSAPKRQLRSCPDQPISITLWPPCAMVNHGHLFDPRVHERQGELLASDRQTRHEIIFAIWHVRLFNFRELS